MTVDGLVGITGWRPFLDTNSSAATFVNEAWSAWNNIQTSSAITTTQTWVSWNTADTLFYDDGGRAARLLEKLQREAMRRPSPEELLLRDWEDALRWDRARTQQIENDLALERANTLLRSVLSAAQRDDLDGIGAFYVKSSGGRLYKIKPGKIHNIILVDPVSKEELLELCVTAQNDYLYPASDVMLAQKLMLEHNEPEALKLANIWDLKRNKKPLTPSEKMTLVEQARRAA